MNALFAQAARAWGVGELVIAFIVVVGILAVGWIAARAVGFPVPQWVWQVVGVVIVVVVCVLAVRFLMGL